MNKQDENKLVMMKALLSFLKLNLSVWQNSVPITDAVQELELLIGELETIRQGTDVDQSGLVVEKKSLRTEVIDEIFDITSQVYAMASKAKDNVLQGKVNFQRSDFDSLRDGVLASTGKNIVSIARENITPMIPYDVTESRLTATDLLIKRYEESIPAPRVNTLGVKADNARIRQLFLNSKTLLNDQLKRLMVRYQNTNPDFYNGYLNAKKVVDYGIRHEKPSDPVVS